MINSKQKSWSPVFLNSSAHCFQKMFVEQIHLPCINASFFFLYPITWLPCQFQSYFRNDLLHLFFQLYFSRLLKQLNGIHLFSLSFIYDQVFAFLFLDFTTLFFNFWLQRQIYELHETYWIWAIPGNGDGRVVIPNLCTFPWENSYPKQMNCA